MAVIQRIRCRVEQVVNHGERVYTIALKPERVIPRFRPGQFLHLALDDYDPSGFWPESRVFSIASPLSDRDRILISYSVRGRFTSRMEMELKEGRRVWIKLPYGEFFISSDNDVVLLAGGTGITAFTAFLANLTPSTQHNVYLAYGARLKSLLIFRDMIERRAGEVSTFHVYYFIENDSVEPLGQKESASPHSKGRLSASALWSDIHKPDGALFYLSGPPLMISTLLKELHDFGVRDEMIKMDAWE